MIREQIANLSSPIARQLLTDVVEAIEDCIEFRDFSISEIRAKFLTIPEIPMMTEAEEKEMRIRNYENQPRDREIEFLEFRMPAACE